MKRLLPAFALGAALLAPLAASAQTTPPPAGNAAKGKAAFLSYGCYECHGTLGQGNLTTAPRLAPHPLPFAALIAYIRQPRGSMPSFSASILPDPVVADIYAYLSSIPAGKDAKDIPLLSNTTNKPK